MDTRMTMGELCQIASGHDYRQVVTVEELLVLLAELRSGEHVPSWYPSPKEVRKLS